MVQIHIFKGAEGKSYAAGEFVFREGDTGSSMYVVQEGELEIMVNGKVIETVTEGGVFGEMALIEDLQRSASVHAKSDSRVVSVDRKRFEFLVQQTPYFAIQIMRILAERLRNANRSL